mgnify:CR=1 FL=1
MVAKLWSIVWPERLGLGGKLGTWAAVALLGYLSVHASALGLAHLQVLRVENQLKYWYKLGKVASPASLESALAAIERANALHPDNPYQLTLQARLLEWRAYNAGQVIVEDYREALSLYQHAAKLRPLWPDNWAEMAQVKVRLNEFDADLNRYLVRADQLGPYTPAVHMAVAQANLPRLSLLVGDQVVLLETHVLRGVQDQRSKSQVLDLVRHYGREEWLCGLVSQVEGVKLPGKFCP